MPGQMCWLGADSDSPKQLYLRLTPSQPWRPYSSFSPPIRVPDYQIPRGSKGYSTYQYLKKLGWQLMTTAEGEQSAKLLEDEFTDSLQTEALNHIR